jgi:uncharacterized protein involved in exopolysaccharide biosynthesis
MDCFSRRTFLIFFVLILTAGAAKHFLTSPLYECSATYQIPAVNISLLEEQNPYPNLDLAILKLKHHYRDRFVSKVQGNWITVNIKNTDPVMAYQEIMSVQSVLAVEGELRSRYYTELLRAEDSYIEKYINSILPSGRPKLSTLSGVDNPFGTNPVLNSASFIEILNRRNVIQAGLMRPDDLEFKVIDEPVVPIKKVGLDPTTYVIGVGSAALFLSIMAAFIVGFTRAVRQTSGCSGN